MSEHHASVVVKAPVHQVYSLFTHFNDFPKFMSFVKEVTYYDDQRSHWVAQILGTHEWDAVNEEWILDRQIGWRSTSGLQNTGKVKFSPVGENQAAIDVYLNYMPSAGALGEVVDRLGVDSRFDEVLQKDLEHFAQMVEQAPPGVLDPMQSHYLFHSESATEKDKITQQQRESMAQDPMMSVEALKNRDTTIQDEAVQQSQAAQERRAEQERQAEQERRVAVAQREALSRQAELNRQEAQERAAIEAQNPPQESTPHPVHDTIGGRNASIDRTAFGDQDARSERFPGYHEDPMTARAPVPQESGAPGMSETELESPWSNTIRGKRPASPEEHEQQENTPPEKST